MNGGDGSPIIFRLPQEVWTQITSFLILEDVLSVASSSRQLSSHVPPSLKYLIIDLRPEPEGRRAQRMNILNLPDAVIERFSNVNKVFIYGLINDIGGGDDNDKKIKVNIANAADKLVSFLGKLKQVGYVHIGRMSDRSGVIDFDENKIRTYRVLYDGFDSCESQEKMALLIADVCKAYMEGGSLSERYIEFDGLLPYQRKSQCIWKSLPVGTISLPPNTNSYEGDNPCPLCQLICSAYPPLAITILEDVETPCFSYRERLCIAKKRIDDTELFQASIKLRLMEELGRAKSIPVWCTPSLKESGVAASYFEWQYTKFQGLCEMGAKCDLDALRKSFLEYRVFSPPGRDFFHREKLLLMRDAFERLSKIGFSISEIDVVIVPETQKRSEAKKNSASL